MSIIAKIVVLNSFFCYSFFLNLYLENRNKLVIKENGKCMKWHVYINLIHFTHNCPMIFIRVIAPYLLFCGVTYISEFVIDTFFVIHKI